ncbi:MAG: hypothetical protein HY205_03615 [Nitrospirae bacterium]|nr:hypothetical protein [Nitrospirota bacterium]
MAKTKDKKVESEGDAIRPGQEVDIFRSYQEPSYYATRIESKFSKDDVCMQFMELLEVRNGRPLVRLLASVWVTIGHYKAIYEMMGRQLAKYEEMFGPIPKSESVKVHPPK